MALSQNILLIQDLLEVSTLLVHFANWVAPLLLPSCLLLKYHFQKSTDIMRYVAYQLQVSERLTNNYSTTSDTDWLDCRSRLTCHSHGEIFGTTSLAVGTFHELPG